MAFFTFRRSFPWLQRTLSPTIPIVGPEVFSDALVSVVDVFGTSRLEEVQFDDVLGGLGVQEATHTQVPANRVRHYLAMQFSHDDTVLRELAPVMIVRTPTGFPATALRDAAQVGQNSIRGITNVVVPPLGFIGARSGGGIGVGARITLRVLWVEMPVGEYLHAARGIGGA